MTVDSVKERMQIPSRPSYALILSDSPTVLPSHSHLFMFL